MIKFYKILFVLIPILLNGCSNQIEKPEQNYNYLLLTFNEPMNQSVLNPNNYFIAPIFSLQPDHVDIFSIQPVNQNLDSIILFIDMKTDSGMYRITVKNVFDTSGNEINLNKNFAFYKK